MIVDISPIPQEDKSVLRNLLNLYLYDLSEFTGKKVNKHGLYEYKRLDQYWYEKTALPFYIVAEGDIAGFILIHQYDLLEQNRFVIAEFFVLRHFRKQGMGKKAIKKVFDHLPGKWEVSQIPENIDSQVFWRNVLEEVTNGDYKETVINGRPVQYFEIL